MGTALAYNISIYKLAGASRAKVTSIRTSGNSFVVPPGILASGTSYFAQLTAAASGGSNASQFVNALQLPKTTTPVLSGILTAP
jgi:hypothetical protein